MSRVAGVTTNARSTAADVKDLADAVAIETEDLEAQVRAIPDQRPGRLDSASDGEADIGLAKPPPMDDLKGARPAGAIL